jgi:hypothetical protein
MDTLKIKPRIIPGGKAADVEGWQPCHFRVPIVLKFGRLNFLEHLGPVQACNGVAVPLPFANRIIVSYCPFFSCFLS